MDHNVIISLRSSPTMPAYSVNMSCFITTSPFSMILSSPSLSGCNKYKLYTDNKVQVLLELIACYNIRTGHQLLEFVHTIDSSTFHWLIQQELEEKVCGSLSLLKEDQGPLAGKKKKHQTKEVNQWTSDWDRDTETDRGGEKTQVKN